MWAGSQFEFRAPVRVGDAVDAHVDDRRRDRARKAAPGTLVFVKVRHEVRAATTPRSRRWSSSTTSSTAKPRSPTTSRRRRKPRRPERAWQREIVPDDVLLFRYSALTFNGHRIHYDRRYVTEVEGYPGLIVHGPLIATLLMDLLRRKLPRRRRRDASASGPCGRCST